jgi:RNA polymerase sigma factor (sigma-70 family)
MSQGEPHYDLDLGKFRDEELVVLAHECGFLPARQELLLRYYDWMRQCIAARARRAGLRAADVEDAQAEAVFSFLEAVARYETLQITIRNGCCFRSFLYTVLAARFLDFLRKLRRTRRRFGCHFSDAPHGEDRSGHGRAGPRNANLPAVAASPAQQTEWRETMACLHRALQRLDDRLHLLWDRLAAGASLHEVAAEWGISYDRVRRWRKEMVNHLKSWLQPGAQEKSAFQAPLSSGGSEQHRQTRG